MVEQVDRLGQIVRDAIVGCHDDRNSWGKIRITDLMELEEYLQKSIAAEARGMAEVERLREALQNVRDCALVVPSIFPDSPPSVSWIVSQLTKVLPEIDAALNGGQHEQP